MNRRRTDPSGKPVIAVRLDGRDKLPSQNPLNAKLKAISRAAESRPAREATQADLDRHMRMQGREQREVDGFKDSTRMRYMQGGDEYAKGGSVKGAAKVAKVMGEFKRGELHSGSKKGPKVSNEKQAKAIAMSEARAAGAKMPAPKKRGVPVASREPMIKATGGLGMAIKR
jgi:hypothetical protein